MPTDSGQALHTNGKKEEKENKVLDTVQKIVEVLAKVIKVLLNIFKLYFMNPVK